MTDHCVLFRAHAVASPTGGVGPGKLDIEHPSGRFTVDIEVVEKNGRYEVRRSALLRTARKLMMGSVFVPATMEVE